MAFKDKLKDWGIMKKDGDGQQGTEKTILPIGKRVVVQTISTSAPPMPTGTDYGKMLDEVLEQGNQAGADFFEFDKALSGMQNTVPENTKYEYAYPAFKAMGVSPEKLVESAGYYLGLLDKEAQRFEGEWSDAQTKQVETKKAIMESLAVENEKLAKQIQENNLKSQKLNEEIFASTNTLNNEKLGFENQLNIKKSGITDRITKIKLYLYAKPSK